MARVGSDKSALPEVDTATHIKRLLYRHVSSLLPEHGHVSRQSAAPRTQAREFSQMYFYPFSDVLRSFDADVAAENEAVNEKAF